MGSPRALPHAIPRPRPRSRSRPRPRSRSSSSSRSRSCSCLRARSRARPQTPAGGLAFKTRWNSRLAITGARPSDARSDAQDMLGTRGGHAAMVEMWRVGGQMQRAERVVGCQSASEPTKLAVSCAWKSLRAAPKFKDEGGSASQPAWDVHEAYLERFFLSFKSGPSSSGLRQRAYSGLRCFVDSWRFPEARALRTRALC